MQRSKYCYIKVLHNLRKELHDSQIIQEFVFDNLLERDWFFKILSMV